MNRTSNDEHQPDDLLGYLLGALDDDEHERVEQCVTQNEALGLELQNIQMRIEPLDGLVPPGPPRAGLARRTCERIAALSLKHVHADKTGPWFTREREPLSTAPSWSLSDFITVAVVALVLGAILLPAVNHSRYQSRVLSCQNNLRQIGTGLLEYASHSNDQFVTIPKEGNLAVAGCYAPKLCEAGYVDDHRLFLCAGLGVTGEREPPSCQEIAAARGNELIEIQKRMGGDYAYSLSYADDGVYMPPRNRHRASYILLADKPSSQFPGRASKNHGGLGQNCFFEDGHISYLSTCDIDGDSIYENDFGNIAPGAHVSDIVVAPSHTRLMYLQ